MGNTEYQAEMTDIVHDGLRVAPSGQVFENDEGLLCNVDALDVPHLQVQCIYQCSMINDMEEDRPCREGWARPGRRPDGHAGRPPAGCADSAPPPTSARSCALSAAFPPGRQSSLWKND